MGYSLAIAVHVITAVLGLGQVTSLALLAPAIEDNPKAMATFERILRLVVVGLVLMLLSGVGLIAISHGASTRTGWFGLSFLLFMGVGAFHGMTRGAVRKAKSPDAAVRSKAFATIQRNAWIMTGLVGAAVYVMRLKPF